MIAPPHSTLPESKKDAKPSTSPSLRLEDWRRRLQTHEQLIVGQPTGRSKKRMKAFLDDIEKKIDGDKEVKEGGTRRHKVNSKKRSSKKTTSK